MDSRVIRNWHCPNCHSEHRSYDSPNLSAFHHCPALNGILTPMVEDGRDAIHKILLREDYVGEDICSVRDANNRVVSSVTTEFADGSNQLTVYMPCATVSAESVKAGVSTVLRSAEATTIQEG